MTVTGTTHTPIIMIPGSMIPGTMIPGIMTHGIMTHGIMIPSITGHHTITDQYTITQDLPI